MSGIQVAALFVRADGPYANRPDVDAWTVDRDARLYSGPWPVVAHPPCARWSRLAHIHGRIGEDDGCFGFAMRAVRRWGGVLEHPEGSMAWDAFALPEPQAGGWQSTIWGGWVAAVDQARYGHRAIKRTWLYFCGPSAPPPLDWARGQAAEELRPRAGRRAAGNDLLGKAERELTPPAFAEALIELAKRSGANS